MKNKLRYLICSFLICILSVQLMPVEVYAKSYSSSKGTQTTSAYILRLILLIVLAVLIPVLKILNNKNSGRSGKSGKHTFHSDITKSYRDGFGFNGNVDDLLEPRNSDGLTENEQLIVDMFSMQAKASKPDPVEIKCPNCGAPVMLSDRIVCSYCRTEISNRSVAQNFKKEDRVVISPKDYNPRRYYDDNKTGYELHDINNSDYENEDYTVETITPKPVDYYGGSSGRNVKRDRHYPGDKWGEGFLGGTFNDNDKF